MKKPFFNHSKELEVEISKYLDLVDRSTLLFKQNVNRYLNKNYHDFEENIDEILQAENDADQYQKDIKYKLYKYMLIPESRADVLSLLERMDNLVDLTKKVIVQFSIERPEIPVSIEDDFKELTEQSVASVTELVRAVRAFFEEISMVNDYINKVHFYEHEADKSEEKIKRKTFSNQNIDEFSKKVHIRYFSEKIALLSDEAETISEFLSVATIKRSI